MRSIGAVCVSLFFTVTLATGANVAKYPFIYVNSKVSVSIAGVNGNIFATMKRLSALFVFAAIVILTACANPRDLEYQDVKNFRLLEVSMKPKVGMDVQFFNPNKFGMTMKDANIDLYINGLLVGNARLANTYNVPANNTFLLP